MLGRSSLDTRDRRPDALVRAGGDQQNGGEGGTEEGDIERDQLRVRKTVERSLEGKDQKERKEDLNPGERGPKTFQNGAEGVIDLIAALICGCLIHRDLSRIRV